MLKFMLILSMIFLVGCSHREVSKSYKTIPSYLDYRGFYCEGNNITVDLNENGTGTFVACKNNEVIRNGPVTSGRPQTHGTPRGTFEVYWKAKEWDSTKYPSTDGTKNMRRALFFHKGFALHSGSVKQLSHGCVHMRFEDADYLFDNYKVGTVIHIN